MSDTPPAAEHACDQCDKSFKAANHLAAHKRQKHGVGGPPSASRGKAAELKRPLQDLVTMVGTGVGTMAMARADDTLAYDAEVIFANAERFADAWVEVAKDNETVRRVLASLVTTSAWSGVAGATVAMLVPVLAAHGMFPAQAALMVGAPEPPPRPEKMVVEVDNNGGVPTADEGFTVPPPPPERPAWPPDVG